MSGGRRVAVTGWGVVTPAGTGIDEFWSALLAGKSTARTLPRLVEAGLPVDFGCEVEGVDELPYLDPKDRRRLSRVTQLAICAGLAAAEDASLGTVDPARAAVICGVGFGGMDVLEAQVEVFTGTGLKRVSPFTVPAIMPNASAAHLSMRLGWEGQTSCPALACAAGAAAIADAFTLVRNGVADVALCGGAESLVTPLAMAAFSRTGAMSGRADAPCDASRPFDSARDGFVMSEGAAFLVLEEWGAAERRGARMVGEVLGAAQTSDAHHLTSPLEDGGGAVRCMNAAIADASIAAGDIGHVNAHGTSTALNDRAEAVACRAVFGEEVPPVTATKGVTGHMIGGSGAAEAVASLLAGRHGVVPPTANLFDPDPYAPAPVSSRPQPAKGDIAISNSFAFGGHNVCLVLRAERAD